MPFLLLFLIVYVIVRTFPDHRQDPDWAHSVWLLRQTAQMPLLAAAIVEGWIGFFAGCPARERRLAAAGLSLYCGSALEILLHFDPIVLDFSSFVQIRQYAQIVEFLLLALGLLYYTRRSWKVQQLDVARYLFLTVFLGVYAVSATFDSRGLARGFLAVTGTMQRSILTASTVLASASILALALWIAAGQQSETEQAGSGDDQGKGTPPRESVHFSPRSIY